MEKSRNFNRIINRDIAEYLVDNFAKKQDYYIVGAFKTPNGSRHIDPRTFVVPVPVGADIKTVKYAVYDTLCKIWGTFVIDHYKYWFGWSLDTWSNDKKEDYINRLISHKCISVTKLEDNIRNPTD